MIRTARVDRVDPAPAALAWQAFFARMDAGDDQKSRDFQNWFNAQYAALCEMCFQNRADQGHRRCTSCRRQTWREKERLHRERIKARLEREEAEARAEV